MKKIYGIIGYPVEHSLSPAMHNAAFKALGIDAEYRKFEITPEELESFLLGDITVKDTDGNSVRNKDIVGFNVTIPHKVRAKEILEAKFPLENDICFVQISGAINTVKREGDKILYKNTDVEGFLRALQVKLGLYIDKEDTKVLLIGCGGAGRACIAGLTAWDDSKVSRIYVYDKSKEIIASAKEHFLKVHKKWQGNLDIYNKIQFIDDDQIAKVIVDCQLLVNATPIGMKETDGSVIDKKLLHKNLSVYDVVYNRESKLVKDAKLLGLKAASGLGMLLYQGVGAFEFWFPDKHPRHVGTMKKALLQAVGFESDNR